MDTLFARKKLDRTIKKRYIHLIFSKKDMHEFDRFNKLVHVVEKKLLIVHKNLRGWK